MKVLGIIGAGDLGQQIAHYALSDNHYSRVVFFDDYAPIASQNEIEILGKVSSVEFFFSNNAFDELIIGIGYKHINQKKALYEKFEKVIPFGKIIHSSAWVDNTAKIAAGCVIYPRCIIDAKAVINDNSVLNIGCTIAHDTIVEAHCFLSPRVAIAGFVKVNQQCIIGINSTIIDNLEIAKETQIGGGAVVIKSINISGLYVGNPAKFIR